MRFCLSILCIPGTLLWAFSLQAVVIMTLWHGNPFRTCGPMLARTSCWTNCLVTVDSRLHDTQWTSLWWNPRHWAFTVLFGTSNLHFSPFYPHIFSMLRKLQRPQSPVETAICKYNAHCIDCRLSVFVKTMCLCLYCLTNNKCTQIKTTHLLISFLAMVLAIKME